MGLNDNIDDGLVNDSPNTPLGIDPTKPPTQIKPVEKIQMGNLDKFIINHDDDNTYTPPTKEQLFGSDIVANKLPDKEIKVKVTDELTKLKDLKYGQSSIYQRGSISQEDMQTLDNIYKGSLINDDNLLGFYTKHASKTNYSQALKQVNDLINKKVFILNENYQKYLSTLKQSTMSFKDTFVVNARTLNGYISMIKTEDETIVEKIVNASKTNDDLEPYSSILTNYINEFDISSVTNSSNIVNNFNQLKESIGTSHKFFKAFIDSYYKKDMTVISPQVIKDKLYHDDTRYSVRDIIYFVVNQLPFLQPAVDRAIDKACVNVSMINNNYINMSADSSTHRIEYISKNQETLDSIEQDLTIFENIVAETIQVCKFISLTITAIELETQDCFEHNDEDNVSVEGFMERIGHGIKKTFTNTNSLIEQLGQVDSWLAGRIQKLDPIEEPGWGRVFNASGKKYITYSDVKKSIQQLNSLVVGSEFDNAITDCVEIIDKVTLAVNKGNLFSNDQSTYEIVNEIEKANEVSKQFSEKIETSADISYDPDFKPLTPKEAKELADTMVKILSYSKTENKVNNLLNSIDAYEKAVKKNKKIRSDKGEASDIRAAEMVIHKLKPSTDAIYEIYKTRKSMAYSLKEYIYRSFR